MEIEHFVILNSGKYESIRMRRRFGFVDFHSSRDADDFIRVCDDYIKTNKKSNKILKNPIRTWKASDCSINAFALKSPIRSVRGVVASVALVLARVAAVAAEVVVEAVPIAPSIVSKWTICRVASSE